MKILADMYAETSRLFIAGSRFAPGDMRLAKLLPQLQKMGERSPAMKRLAGMTEETLNSPAPETALPELGALLLAIMCTQGETCPENLTEQENAPLFDELPYTAAPYSAIEPVVAAFTTTGQGRRETIEAAFAAGILNDFRLYGHIAAALDDKYSEIAEFVRAKAIAAIGKPMVPFLLRDLDVSGKRKSDAARMELLDALDCGHICELAEKALDEGSPQVKVEAIKILGRKAAHEELLLKYADEKKLDVKEAALIGLVRLGSARGYEKFLSVLESKQYGPAIEAVRHFNNPGCMERLSDIIAEKFKAQIANKDMQTLHLLSLAVSGMGDSHGHEAAVKIYERVFATPAFAKRGWGFASHYFHQAKHVYAPEQVCEVFVGYYAADHKRQFNYECMELALGSGKRDMALDYLKKYFMRKEHGAEKLYEAANLLARHMEGRHLPFVAKWVHESLVGHKYNGYFVAHYAGTHIFEHPEVVEKIFRESGRRHLLEEIKDLYIGKGGGGFKDFAALLEKY